MAPSPRTRFLGWFILVASLLGILMLAAAVGCWLPAYSHGAAGPSATPTPSTAATDTPTRLAATQTHAQSDTPRPSPTSAPSSSTLQPTASPVPTLAATAASDDRSGEPTPYPTLALPEGPIVVSGNLSSGLAFPGPGQVPLVDQPDNTINIVVLGSDQTSFKEVGRTDVMVIVSINPDTPAVSLLSIPRDFYAWLPGRGYNKINTAFTYGERDKYPGGGPGLTKATIEYNLGIRVHYFARVSFEGFIQIVDALDGVNVAVECPIHDTFPDSESPTGRTDVDLLPGIHQFDGKHALWYVRSRYGSSDFHRNRRQQQVLRAMYAQAVNIGLIAKLPELWSVLNEAVSTDLGLGEMLYLANVASRLDTINVKSRFLGPGVLQAQTTAGGLYVLVPDPLKLQAMVSEALAPPAAGRAERLPFRVDVLNATPWDELGYVAAERLRWENFEVVGVERADEVMPRTRVYDYTTTAKGSPLPSLMQLYRRSSSDVTTEPTAESPVDFLVVLGADYNPCTGPWEAQSYLQ